MSTIEINPQFEQVLSFVNQTNQLIFLTGKAGTGKTTLLKYIRQKTFKQMSVVAPTGVAAINAGGSTIHSFFQFPFAPFIPHLKDNGEADVLKINLPTLKYNSQRLAIFRNLELLVIDEVSMVRADLLDQIDVTLRFTRKKSHLPFGGVQVLLIGDMYQLPPVIQNEEWQLLSKVYKSGYFFESVVVRNNPPVYIELEKIYRQSESKFIDLLNKVRNNVMDEESLQLLNSHYKANLTDDDYRNNITLTTHNKKADEINQRNLNSLDEKEYKFRSKVEGQFSDKNFPADEVLTLKKGTRVMFLKNNNEKNYYNGKIGIVSYVDQDKIRVKCEEDNYETEVGRESWTNVSYKLDKSSKHIDEEVLGTFNQYPLRLAWAITIHKSQGLTFDKLIIDAAEAFSAGQVYVALSRCRSLSGLTLSSRISRNSLLNDQNILNFAGKRHNNEQVNTIFSNAQRSYVKTVLVDMFDLTEQVERVKELSGIVYLHKKRINEDGQQWVSAFSDQLNTLNDISAKFKMQLAGLVDQALSVETDQPLQQRIMKASEYFEAAYKKIIEDLKNCPLITESKEAAGELNDILQLLFDAFYLKHNLVITCKKGFIFSDFITKKLKLVFPEYKVNMYASAKNSRVSADIKHPELYRALMLTRDQICNDEHAPIYMVANNKALTELANFLPVTNDDLLQITGFGQARADAYGGEFLKVIKEFLAENNLTTAMHLKEKKKKKAKEKVLGDNEEAGNNNKKLNTKEHTFMLYRQGLSLEQIARERSLSVGTVEGHLVPYVSAGDIKIDDLVPEKKQKLILDALKDFNKEGGINPIKNKLPEDISYADIRFVLALKDKD